MAIIVMVVTSLRRHLQSYVLRVVSARQVQLLKCAPTASTSRCKVNRNAYHAPRVTRALLNQQLLTVVKTSIVRPTMPKQPLVRTATTLSALMLRVFTSASRVHQASTASMTIKVS